MFQKNEFRAEVVRNGMSLEDVAKAIGINYVSLHRKMNGTSDFYRGEIEKIVRLLNLSGEDVLRIFLQSNLRKCKLRKENDMSDLVTFDGNQVVTDSRSVAKHFEKEHRDVLKAIRHLVEGVRKSSQTPLDVPRNDIRQ